MGGLIQGAATGAAFELLFLSVVDAARKARRFNSDLSRLESILASIRVSIDDVECFNKILDRPLQETEAFTARLLEGEKLVRRCSRIHKFNVVMRVYYSKKLSNLESSLLKFFQLNVAALHFRETKRISVVVSDLEAKMKELISMMSRFGIAHDSDLKRRISEESGGTS